MNKPKDFKLKIREIHAKTILVKCKNPEAWFGVAFHLNVYRGCPHGCIYCDSRSECYGIEDFDELVVKVNAPELLRRELASKRAVGTVGTGAMSDPYNPAEEQLRLTRRVLETLVEFGRPVHVITKSDLILRDRDLLQKANRIFASVAFTVTTVDDALAARIEPGAPSPSLRLQAMKTLSDAGIYAGALMMPVLPFIEDHPDNIQAILRRTRECGGSFVIPWFGMSLRDRQREYYYRSLDRLFPGLSERYRRKFGNAYNCLAPDHHQLQRIFTDWCREYGLAGEMRDVKQYRPEAPSQLSLFANDSDLPRRRTVFENEDY